MRKIRVQKPANDRLREAFGRDLNPTQAEAATAPDGYNLILAGPGSGKTRVITYRVAWLIASGVPAESILLATFTRRAAREMLGRLEALIGTGAGRVWAGTFHHIGNRILRKYAATLGYTPDFTILDSEDQSDLVKLAMADAGLVGKPKLTPKPSTVGHLISYAFNVGRPIAEVVDDRYPALLEWSDEIAQVADRYAARKRAANCLDYDDLLGQWSRLLTDFVGPREAIARGFRHILVDEMQDTNRVQIDLVETLTRAGSGNLTAVGDDAQSIYKFRGANYDNILKFPDRNPDARVFRLEVNYRSTPEIVAFTNASIAHNITGFPKTLVSARAGGLRPVAVPCEDAYEEADVVCQLILDGREAGVGLGRQAVLYRNHHDSILLQGELVNRGIPYTVRSGVRFFEQAHVKDVLAYLRVISNGRDDPAWRRLLLLLPGIGPAKASALLDRVIGQADPLAAIGTAEVMAAVPAKSKGLFAAFVGDLRKIQAVEPRFNPASAIAAVLGGGYPSTVRARYENPENRLADLEQLGVLAARYDSLDRLIADLLLAGDVYGVETIQAEEPGEVLTLSTIHQAKGLEWSRVFVPRLVDEGFPSPRALGEPDGEEEERRIFYVAVTRAMDELFLTYPLLISRGGRGPTLIARPSRFLTEIDPELYEPAEVETARDDPWKPV